MDKKIEEYEGTIKQLKVFLKRDIEKRKQLENLYDGLKQSNEEKEEKIKSLEKIVNEVTSVGGSSNEILAQKDEEINKLKKINESLEDKIKNLTYQCNEKLQNSNKQVESKNDAWDFSDDVEEHHEGKNEELEILQKKYDTLKKDYASKLKEIERLTANRPNNSVTGTYGSSRDEEIDGLNQCIKILQKENEKIKAEFNAKLKEMESKSNNIQDPWNIEMFGDDEKHNQDEIEAKNDEIRLLNERIKVLEAKNDSLIKEMNVKLGKQSDPWDISFDDDNEHENSETNIKGKETLSINRKSSEDIDKAKLISEMNEKENEINRLNRDLHILQEESKKIEHDYMIRIKELEKQIEDCKFSPWGADTDNDSEISEKKDEINMLNEKITSLQQENDRLRQDFDAKLEASIEANYAEFSENVISAKDEEIKKLNERISSLTEEYKLVQCELDQCKHAISLKDKDDSASVGFDGNTNQVNRPCKIDVQNKNAESMCNGDSSLLYNFENRHDGAYIQDSQKDGCNLEMFVNKNELIEKDNQISHLNDQISSLKNRISMIEMEKDSISTKFEEDLNEKEKSLSAVNELICKKDEEIAQLYRTISAIQEENKEVKSLNDELNQKLLSSSLATTIEANERMSKVSNELQDRDSKTCSKNEVILDLQDQLINQSSIVKNADALNNDVVNLQQKYADLENENAKIKEENEIHRRNALKLRDLLTNFQNENSRYKVDNEQLSKQVQSLTTRLSEQANFQGKLKTDIESDSIIIKDLRDKLKETEERLLSSDESQKLQMETKLMQMKNISNEYKRKITTIIQKNNSLQMDLDKANKKIELLTNQIEHQACEMKEMENMLSYNNTNTQNDTKEKNQIQEELEKQRSEVARLMIEKQNLESVIHLEKQKKDQVKLDVFISSVFNREEITQYDIDKKDIHDPYFKRIILEFFSQDDKSRAALIPVILRFIGCHDYQIDKALQLWNNSRSFWSINK